MTAAGALLCLVVGITDGDTLKARCDGQQISVRLAEIDAPEKAQPFGARAKESLSDLCFQRTAQIVSTGHDRYGRTIGQVSCAGTDANAEQVRRGMAWVYDRYVTDHNLYRIQAAARESRRGLWSESTPTAPWEWRKARKAARHTSVGNNSAIDFLNP